MCILLVSGIITFLFSLIQPLDADRQNTQNEVTTKS